jgi:RHS repeat-associated protein
LLLDDSDHSYIYGPSSTPIAQVDDTSGAIEYLHADALGTPRAITNSAGTVTGTQSFDAYGTQTASSDTASTVFGFTGNLTDAITGLLYLRARDYDPATGQFLTVDPALDSTHQPYAYVGNDPVLNTDPRGLCPVNGGDFVADCTPEDFGGSSWLLSPAATVLGDIFSSCSVMNVSSLFAGITDTITFGGTRLLRDALAPGWSERYESNGFYFVGAAWGIVATSGLGASAGISAWIRSTRLAATVQDVRAIIPEGLTLASWGKIVWGHGAAEAQALIGTRSVSQLSEIGLTFASARILRNLYIGATTVAHARGAATAPERIKLLESIMKTLLTKGFL